MSEEVSEWLNGLGLGQYSPVFEENAVENNKGTVCRFMGDGIMAMFGAPTASERHALEACFAALAMQNSIDEYANDLEASHDPYIQIRVGLHSGEVVVLEVGDDPDKPEYDASSPEVFSQANSSIFCLLTRGDPRRSRAFRYRDSSYATPVCQQR